MPDKFALIKAFQRLREFPLSLCLFWKAIWKIDTAFRPEIEQHIHHHDRRFKTRQLEPIPTILSLAYDFIAILQRHSSGMKR